MFMGLTTEAADGSVVPGAAESWQVSDDGLTWDFKLRAHQWSDGRPVTAQDFVYSFRRMLAPETACLYADFFFVIEGARGYTSGRSPAEALAVTAPAEDHLRIVLRRPVAYFPGLLMHFAAMPVPRHVIEAEGTDWTEPEHIVVNGAFVLQRRIPNERVTLRKNPRFFGADEVRLPGVIYYSQENRDAAVQRYRAGGLDVLRDFPAGKADWLREQFGAAVRTSPYLGLTYVVVNHRRPALDRRAGPRSPVTGSRAAHPCRAHPGQRRAARLQPGAARHRPLRRACALHVRRLAAGPPCCAGA
jgi:oligopeptide transport system substrate-binding protein